MQNYPQIYRMLKRNGHSPAKAVEILLDAKRGDAYALQWITTLFRIRHS